MTDSIGTWQQLGAATELPKYTKTVFQNQNAIFVKEMVISTKMAKPASWMKDQPAQGAFIKNASNAGEAYFFRVSKEWAGDITTTAFLTTAKDAAKQWGNFDQIREIKVETFECGEWIEGRCWATRTGFV